jgi:hypothetical protein
MVVVGRSNGSHRGIVISVNRGRSWTVQDGGLPGHTGVRSAVFSPGFAQDGTMFAGLSGQSGGLFKSMDRGGTWHPVHVGPVANVEAVAVSPSYTADRTVYAGTDGFGVWCSTDGGDHWSHLDDGPHDPRIRALAVMASLEPALLAGTRGSGVWEYRSATTTPTPTSSCTATPTATATSTATTTPSVPGTVTVTPTVTCTATASPTPTELPTGPAFAVYLPVVLGH